MLGNSQGAFSKTFPSLKVSPAAYLKFAFILSIPLTKIAPEDSEETPYYLQNELQVKPSEKKKLCNSCPIRLFATIFSFLITYYIKSRLI